jgi:N-acetylmuramoyl-L-alanine amidase
MGRTICLDAGHYGKYNRSPAVKDYYESDMAWKLHLLLKKELESYGFNVIQTRNTQEKDLGLYERGAASKGCDLFLSIHSNAVGEETNESVDYPLVIVQLDGKGTELGEKLAGCIKMTMGTNQIAKVITKKGNSGEYYGVLRGAAAVGTMGMILEHSFHTNTKMAKWLLDEKNLGKMAKAEAKVIADYYGAKKGTTKMVAVKLPALKKGDKGDSVKAMQILLINHGFSCGEKGADGSYGSATEKALHAFKKANGLKVTSTCGVQTWSALMGV